MSECNVGPVCNVPRFTGNESGYVGLPGKCGRGRTEGKRSIPYESVRSRTWNDLVGPNVERVRSNAVHIAKRIGVWYLNGNGGCRTFDGSDVVNKQTRLARCIELAIDDSHFIDERRNANGRDHNGIACDVSQQQYRPAIDISSADGESAVTESERGEFCTAVRRIDRTIQTLRDQRCAQYERVATVGNVEQGQRHSAGQLCICLTEKG